MKEVYIVWECDAWHSNASKEMVGVFSSKNNAVMAILDMVSTTSDEETDEVEKQLKEIGQTQGYDTNYIIESYQLDVIND